MSWILSDKDADLVGQAEPLADLILEGLVQAKAAIYAITRGGDGANSDRSVRNGADFPRSSMHRPVIANSARRATRRRAISAIDTIKPISKAVATRIAIRTSGKAT